jgi:hypothetical protein
MITQTALLEMSQDELDELYRNSANGAIPNGDSKGTAIITAGSSLAKPLATLIQVMLWKGKVFYRDRGFLVNKVFLFGSKLIKA